VETFLVRVLGLERERVHAEAHRWEHALSDEVVERLDAWLGHPRRDPHGTPIPAAPRRRAAPRRLTELETGEQGVVLTAGGSDDRHAAYIRQLGLVPGAVVRVVRRRPFGGPRTLEIANRRSIVGPEVTDFVNLREEEES
jgi:DtxR family Mn-dependent transcriptional regulator